MTNENIENDFEYTGQFVAFIDVLGFTNMVNRVSDSDRRKILSYYKISDYIIKTWQEIGEKKEIQSIVVSDSIILSVPVCSHGPTIENKRNVFKHLCIAVNNLQFFLAQQDIWTRGAITVGDMYFDNCKKQFFGPAYIEAYKMEREAKFPRVILSSTLDDFLQYSSRNEFLQYINSNNNFKNWNGDVVFNKCQYEEGKRYFCSESILFLDYLNYLFKPNSTYSRLESVLDSLHAKIFEDNSHYEKYKWIADYLITKCELIEEQDRKEKYIERLKLI